MGAGLLMMRILLTGDDDYGAECILASILDRVDYMKSDPKRVNVILYWREGAS